MTLSVKADARPAEDERDRSIGAGGGACRAYPFDACLRITVIGVIGLGHPNRLHKMKILGLDRSTARHRNRRQQRRDRFLSRVSAA
jgi:hypothetical protein